MSAPDSRIYASVYLTDHSLQYSLTIGINAVATPINFLSFYLILTQSKRERSSYKVCLFLSQLSFYIAQLYLGVVAGLVTLHPFPGIYAVGLLKEHFSSFTLCLIWCILFSFSIYTTFLLLVIQLRIVARPGKRFDCGNCTYSLACIALAVFIFVPVPTMLVMSYSSRENMEQFVQTRFPNNMAIFNVPGVHIFTNYESSGWIQGATIFAVFSALVFVFSMYIAISREIQRSVIPQSVRHGHDSRKVLKNFVIQSMSYSLFLSVAMCIIIKACFNDPSVDSRVPNSIAFTCFCGASIPYQIMMISRNTAYREFVFRGFKAPSKIAVLYQH